MILSAPVNPICYDDYIADTDINNIFTALFTKALTNVDVKDLITNVGSAAASGPATGASAGAAAEVVEEKVEEEEEEEEGDDMGFGLFD